MVKVAICDDDKWVTQQMEDILDRYAADHAIHIEVDVFYNGVELIRYMDKNKETYDILFLDIEMKEMNGLDTAKRIREMDDRRTLIVYVTSHESYALEAYEVHPFHFLVKPLNEDAVRKCFEQAYNHIAPEELYFEFAYKKNKYRESISEIMYFTSCKRVIEIHMQDNRILEFYGKLDDVEEKLQPLKTDFWRIHQSTLVNASYIYKKTFSYVELVNGEQLSISKEKSRELNALYIQNVSKRMEM